MHALITRSPIIDNSFSNDHRVAVVLEFKNSPIGRADPVRSLHL